VAARVCPGLPYVRLASFAGHTENLLPSHADAH
jgi:hypothetical protein